MQYQYLSGWESSVLASMRSMTVYTPGGGAALNTRIVNNLHARYIAAIADGAGLPTYTPGDNAAARALMLRLASESGYSTAIVRSFLVSLYTLQKNGKIPIVKYDPVGAADRAAVRDRVDPSVLSRVTKTAAGVTSGIGKLGIGLALVAALGAAVYFKLGRK